MDIDHLNLSVRTKNILRAELIETVQDLARLSVVDLLQIPSIGRKTLREIEAALEPVEPQATVYPSHLTLRSWFAGQALMGLLAGNRLPFDEVIERCWRLADEMIESSPESKEPYA